MVWFVALHMVSCLKGHKMGVLWWGSWVYVAYTDCYFGFKPDLPNFSILLPWWGEVVKVTSSDGSVISFIFVLKSLLRVFKIRNQSKNSSAKKASSLVLPKGWACRQAQPQLVPSDNQHLTANYTLQLLVIILRGKPTESRKSTLLPAAFQSVGISICTYVYNYRRRCLRKKLHASRSPLCHDYCKFGGGEYFAAFSPSATRVACRTWPVWQMGCRRAAPCLAHHQ